MDVESLLQDYQQHMETLEKDGQRQMCTRPTAGYYDNGES